jgi:hypothetical protein
VDWKVLGMSGNDGGSSSAASRLLARHPRRKVDGDLLVGDGDLQRGLAAGQQPVDHLLLLLLARRLKASARLISGWSVWRENWWENRIDSTSTPFMRMTLVSV